MSYSTLTDGIVDCITTQDATEKARKTRALIAEWRDGKITDIGDCPPPDRPGRLPFPELRPPRDVPKRRITGGIAGRVALIHAIAHIELNAIDLALDMACRFVDQRLPLDFYRDWLSVADDESRHFLMLNDRLALLDAHYGDLPAHDGLWQAAQETAHDLLGRLAIAPLVLEARGLDVTPNMIKLFEGSGEKKAVEYLNIIYSEEVSHVSYGSKWFNFLCGRNNLDPKLTFHQLVRTYFHTTLKPPFNEEKRADSGLPPDFYWPLTENEP